MPWEEAECKDATNRTSYWFDTATAQTGRSGDGVLKVAAQGRGVTLEMLAVADVVQAEKFRVL